MEDGSFHPAARLLAAVLAAAWMSGEVLAAPAAKALAQQIRW